MQHCAMISRVISVVEGDLGRMNVLKHKVNTGDATIHQMPRRLPCHQKCADQGNVRPGGNRTAVGYCGLGFSNCVSKEEGWHF